MFAKVEILGVLVREAELKSGNKDDYILLKLGITKPDGQKDYFDVFIYSEEAKKLFLTRVVPKGSLLFLEGDLQKAFWSETPNKYVVNAYKVRVIRYGGAK